MKLTLTSGFKIHLEQTRERGLKLSTLAALTGFNNSANLLCQLRVPFAATRHNRERWQTVAVLTNFAAELFEQEKEARS